MSDVPQDTMPLVSVMDQLPQTTASEDIRVESPLHHVDFESVASEGAGKSGVVLQELSLLGHLVVRGSVENLAFVNGIEKVLGVPLPGPLGSAESGEISIRWISPDEWLVIVPGEDAFRYECSLREAINGHFAIVNVSGGQTVLQLSGESTRAVLMKLTSYDVHDRNFPVGKVVTTVIAKTQAVIRRTGIDSWELVVRRSFCDYVWLWLRDACSEFGLTVTS
jgi:sarcosine oxidase subunit gamma